MAAMAKAEHIAILGWGSLLWEPNDAFNEWRDDWLFDGPEIKLEFSRISSSRQCALTLVIDEEHGTATTVSYCFSKRANTENAVADLRCREGTSVENIKCILRGTRHAPSRNVEAYAAISAWLEKKQLDAAVWTNLKSNFEEVCGSPFSVEAAIRHLQSLEPEPKVIAAEYIWRAPDFVQTELRKAIEVHPWFQQARKSDGRTSP